MSSSVPDLPGTLVPRYSDQERWLKSHVARLCGLEHERFPGSQPVSFGVKDLLKLEQTDFWVCEKSDGVRVLFLIAYDPATNTQAVFLIDRHNSYREITGFCFPHHEDPRQNLRNSLVDGELVLDTDPKTGKRTLRFLAFDCLVIDDQNVMTKTLDKRYGVSGVSIVPPLSVFLYPSISPRPVQSPKTNAHDLRLTQRLKEWFFRPYNRMMQDHPQMAELQPFDIRVKDINLAYHVDKVFNVDIPNLQHGNDGLIYTCVSTPYLPGTDKNILKWKPPSENSIDFKLVLRFPPSLNNPREPDYHAKPFFLLHIWHGGERNNAKYELYDYMNVTDEEWEALKLSGEQIDDRVVEVHWDPKVSGWKMMRFRDDKPHGNHSTVVENIIQSIADGVEKDALLARSNAIRNAWKTRQGQPPGPPGPPPLPQHAPPPQQQLQRGGPPQQPPPTGHFQSGHFQRQQEVKPRSVPAAHSVIRYGPLAPSPWSKVAGPAMVCGMRR